MYCSYIKTKNLGTFGTCCNHSRKNAFGENTMEKTVFTLLWIEYNCDLLVTVMNLGYHENRELIKQLNFPTLKEITCLVSMLVDLFQKEIN